MKNQLSLIAIAFILAITGGCQKNTISSNEPQEVVITGQVINKRNYDPNTVAIIINDVATGEQIRFLDDLDEEGNFEIRFERYYPQEIMLKYFSIWNVFTHPGDSIHIELDAEKMSSNDEIYKALKFSGDADKENEQLLIFDAWFSPIRKKDSKSNKEENRYLPEQYIAYRDSLRNEYHQIAEELIVNNKISEPINTWIHYEIEHDYFHNLVNYPRVHRYMNNYPRSWDVPVSYYDFYENANFNSEFILNSHLAKSFVNEYYVFYVGGKIGEELSAKGLVKDTIFSDGRTVPLWKIENLDLVNIDGIKRFSPKGIRQFVLNRYFISQLRYSADTEVYEKHMALINEEIKEPFLLANL